MKMNSSFENISLKHVIELLEDPESLNELFLDLDNKNQYIKEILKDYELHKESLSIATEMSEPMPLGPALVVGATIYIFLGDYFISFMNFQ